MDAKLAIALALSFVPGEATTSATTPTIAVRADACDCRNCKCGIACDCADTVVSVKTAKPSAAKEVATTTRTVVAHGYSTTHTHACPNKECPFRKAYGEPFVWGGKDHGHACPYCQTEQTVTSNRPTTILREVSVANAAPVTITTSPTVVGQLRNPRSAIAPPAAMSLTTLQSSVSAGGCANGQCSNVSRGGLFRWR